MDEQTGPENSLNQTKIASCAVFLTNSAVQFFDCKSLTKLANKSTQKQKTESVCKKKTCK